MACRISSLFLPFCKAFYHTVSPNIKIRERDTYQEGLGWAGYVLVGSWGHEVVVASVRRPRELTSGELYMELEEWGGLITFFNFLAISLYFKSYHTLRSLRRISVFVYNIRTKVAFSFSTCIFPYFPFGYHRGRVFL